MQKYKISLKTEEDLSNTDLRIFSRGLNRQVIQWLSKGNKDLLDEMKSKADLRPFNISFLKTKDNSYYFFVTILDEKLKFSEALINGIDKSDDEIIDLDYRKFSLVGYEKIFEINTALFVEKAEKFDDKKIITFTFVSPTTFIRKTVNNEEGLGEYPFPDPTRIFDSVIHRWNKFAISNFDIEEIITTVNKYIYIQDLEIKAENFSLGISNSKNMNITGFTGKITLQVKTKNLTLKRLIFLLALYAEWCGVGKKTAFGLGQVRTYIK
jgi:CRISPR-associated endoribonuclease Cas6